mgnify:CR=1 FL=1
MRKCRGTRSLVIWAVAVAVVVLDGAPAAQNIVLEQVLVKVNGAIITRPSWRSARFKCCGESATKAM